MSHQDDTLSELNEIEELIHETEVLEKLILKKEEDLLKKLKLEIFVNENSVVLKGKEHTGYQIKQAAISQGVNIQLDFILSIEKANGKFKIVKDDEVIKIKKHEKFVAVADDDNS